MKIKRTIVSFDEESKSDKCPSCGVKYTDHPGLIPTCKELKELKNELRSLKESIEYDGHSDVDTLNLAYGKICELVEKK